MKFYAPDVFIQKARKDHTAITCPDGHAYWYKPQESKSVVSEKEKEKIILNKAKEFGEAAGTKIIRPIRRRFTFAKKV